MKKISLYILIISLGWLPIQVTASSSFFVSTSATAPTELTSLSVGQSDLAKSAHCETQQSVSDCCNDVNGCSHIDHDCNHCVSFVAMSQDFQTKILSSTYYLQHSYSQPLIGSSSHSEYRPPRSV